MVPTITWRPWNPVATKKVEPNTESEIENDASWYSMPWRNVKYDPKKIVNVSETKHWLWLFSKNPLWAHVTLIPEDNRTTVFSKGTPQGLKAWTPSGGQEDPTSILGDRAEWKKAQKNDKKKNTSEVINNNIPQRRPANTIIVWSPWNAPSRETSRHHKKEVILRVKILKTNNAILFIWNHDTSPVVTPSLKKEAKIGQGDSSVRWKGWFTGCPVKVAMRDSI